MSPRSRRSGRTASSVYSRRSAEHVVFAPLSWELVKTHFVAREKGLSEKPGTCRGFHQRGLLRTRTVSGRLLAGWGHRIAPPGQHAAQDLHPQSRHRTMAKSGRYVSCRSASASSGRRKDLRTGENTSGTTTGAAAAKTLRTLAQARFGSGFRISEPKVSRASKTPTSRTAWLSRIMRSLCRGRGSLIYPPTGVDRDGSLT
jgi:hypothetical protein